jgi:hypothetical protein
LPLTVYDGKKNLVTTAQFFALWRGRTNGVHMFRRRREMSQMPGEAGAI